MKRHPFPYLSGSESPLNTKQWLVLVASVFLAFAVLEFLAENENTTPIGALIFFGLPIVAIQFGAKADWRELIRLPSLREVGIGLGFAIVNLVVTLVMGSIVVAITGIADKNEAVTKLAEASATEFATFFVMTIPQLMGEELFSIIPFLAILHLLNWEEDGSSRRKHLAIATVLTALLFGAAHLPTYNWNWAQCLFVIGSARIVLLIPFILTRNITVPFIAHFTFDWMVFLMVMFLSSQTP